MDRRNFLTQSLAAGLCLSRPKAAHAAAAPVTTPLTEQLTLISGYGGNVVLFDSPEGVLLVDGGSPERSASVLRTVARLTHAPRVHTLFNTHWHWDQTGSNAALGRRGTRIIAHENTRLWLGTDVNSTWQRRVFARLPPQARPNMTFYTNGTLEFGGESISYGYLPQSHTDGDIYVHFRNANVIVAGDVASTGAYPIIDYVTGGWIGGMVDATNMLLQLGNAGTRFVPGTGPLLTQGDLQAESEMLVAVKHRLSRLLAQGMSVKDMIEAAPTRDYDAKWGDPSLFIANVWQGLVRRPGELDVYIL